MSIVILIFIIYYDLSTWFNIDKEHRKYYIMFIVNALLCVLTIIVIAYEQLWFGKVLPLATADVLMIDSFVRRKLMIRDLKNKKFQKTKQNDK